MYLRSISANNFRTLSGFNLRFEEYYTAICGRNNSGKTNVVKAIRFLLGDPSPIYWEEVPEILFKRDKTAWDASGEPAPITISATVELDRTTDQGLVEFLTKFSPSLSGPRAAPGDPISITLNAEIGPIPGREKYEAFVNSVTLDDFSSQELVKKLRNSSACTYHNSTTVMRQRYLHGGRLSLSGSLSDVRQKKLADKQNALSRELERCLVEYRQEMAAMIGRLSDKYSVTLNIPSLSFEQMPFGISLGDKGYDVPLDEWGSGTRNRTIILKTLFEAQRASAAGRVSDRVTPIVVIEEPESFLHPSAQAEFGAVLQDLSHELKIQLVVTSHSPYMLSHKQASANVLLERRTKLVRGRGTGKGNSSTRFLETQRTATDGNDWKRPFEHALGVAGPEFEYLKHAIFTNAKEIILCEGPIDKEYLDDLREESHGHNSLSLRGEVVSYDGAGNLKNQAILKFMLSMFRVPLVTFDLDQEKELVPVLERLGRQQDKDYFMVGRDLPGKRCIEGLLPPEIIQAVGADHPDVVLALNDGRSDERKKAKETFKRLCRDRFKAEARPHTPAFAEFYKLTKLLNKAIALHREGVPATDA